MSVDLDRQKLVQEVRSLRKGRGIGLDSYAKCTEIIKVINLPDLTDSLAAFIRGTLAQEDTREMTAIKNAYGLDGQSTKDSLTARRVELAHKQNVSTKTIETWENRGVELLVDALLYVGRDKVPTHEQTSLFIESGSIIWVNRERYYNKAEPDSLRKAATVETDRINRPSDDPFPSLPFYWHTFLANDTTPMTFRLVFDSRPDLVLVHAYLDQVQACMQGHPLAEEVIEGLRHVFPEGEQHEWGSVWVYDVPPLQHQFAGMVVLLHWAGKGADGTHYGFISPAGKTNDPQQHLF